MATAMSALRHEKERKTAGRTASGIHKNAEMMRSNDIMGGFMATRTADEAVLLEGTLMKQLSLPGADGHRTWRPFNVVLTREALYFYDHDLRLVSDVLRLDQVSRVTCDDDSAVHAGKKSFFDVQRIVNILPAFLRSKISSMSAVNTARLNPESFNTHSDLQAGLATLKKTMESFSDKTTRFDLTTRSDGIKRGRVYHMSVDESGDLRRDQWFVAILQQVKDAKKRLRAQQFAIERLRKWLRRSVESEWCQSLIGLLIAGNFVANCIEAEWNPTSGRLQTLFINLDISFTILFVFEVILRIFAFGLNFFRDGWNAMDMVVVSVSVISLVIGMSSESGTSDSRFASLRTIRALRIIRVFRHFRSMHTIVLALLESLFPIANALMVMALTMVVYAIIGVSFYRKQSERFQTFSSSMFTMFQVVTGDSWTSIVLSLSEPVYDEDDVRLVVFDAGPVMYLGSFVLVVGWILFNVVVAVMLEAFLDASAKSKQDRDKELTLHVQGSEQKIEGKRDSRVTTIDPVLEMLLQFKNKTHLHELIEMLFHVMDSDGSGLLEYTDLAEGFKALKIPVIIDEEVWSGISEGKMDNITLQDFTECMKHQLKMYMETLVADEMLLATLTDNQSRPLLSALKLLMLNTCIDTEAPSIADTVKTICDMVQLQEKRMTRLEKFLNVDTSELHDIGNQDGQDIPNTQHHHVTAPKEGRAQKVVEVSGSNGKLTKRGEDFSLVDLNKHLAQPTSTRKESDIKLPEGGDTRATRRRQKRILSAVELQEGVQKGDAGRSAHKEEDNLAVLEHQEEDNTPLADDRSETLLASRRSRRRANKDSEAPAAC